MGKKPRSKGIDVTKSFLQSASVSDFIAVQVSPNNVVTVAEEELSPTQGSEAAFALRRDGKLDSTMKLCLNWRAGACHNFAACTFAHITKFYGVDSSNTPAGSNGGDAVAGGGVAASAHASGSAGRSATNTASGAGDARSPWLAKVAPPTGAGVAARAPQTNWGSKAAAAAAAPGHDCVDLAEAMAAKASQQQGRPARAATAAATTTKSPPQAPTLTSVASGTGAVAETASTPKEVSEAASFPPLASTPNKPLAGSAETTAPAVRELLLRQLTGSEAVANGNAPNSVATPSTAAAGTPRHQRVPAPRSGLFSTSPFATSAYAAGQPAAAPGSQWGSVFMARSVPHPVHAEPTVPQVSPSLGHPSPAIRQLMALLTADE